MKQKILCFFMIGVLLIGSVYAQDRRISGSVTTSGTGEPLSGVTVVVTGATGGTATDGNGRYSLSVPDNAKSLTFSIIGYTSQTIPIGNQDIINVTLDSEFSELMEVVVTAQSISREKKTLGYSAPTISSDELLQGRNVSAINSLAGKVAGVNITSTANSPGSSSRIVFRGGTSISGNNQALIVVDGVPIDNSSIIGGVNALSSLDFGNRGNDINTDDIESVTALKGPAAAALYGSRASNGALIITTKKGKQGAEKTEITFNTSNTLSSILKLPDFQNEYGQGYLAGFDADGNPVYETDPKENWSWGAPFTGEMQEWGQEIDGVRLQKPYAVLPNNVRNFFDTGIASDNNLSFSGGGEKTSFYLGLNSLNSDGVYPTSTDSYNRYGIRFNGTAEFSNKFNAGVSVNYSRINSSTVGGGQNNASVYDKVLQTARDIPIDEMGDLSNKYYSFGYLGDDGVPHDDLYGYTGAYALSPYYVLDAFENLNEVNRITGNVNMGYKPVEWLNFQERIGVDTYTDRRRRLSPKYEFYPADKTSGNYDDDDNAYVSNGAYEIRQINVSEIVHDFMATATHRFNSDFQGSLMIGNNIRQRFVTDNQTATNASGGLVVPEWYNLANSNGPVNVVRDSYSRRRLVGVYADLNLAYKNMLFFEATARNDWSSTLPKNNNSFFYPSVSSSFVFSELLNQESDVLSFGKVRASWAQVGNDTDPYQLLTTFSRGQISGNFGSTTFPFGNVAALMSSSTIGNEVLKPEITTSIEVGTELGFFIGNRLSLDFTYYRNSSRDQILTIPIAESTGYGFKVINAGKVENNGVELAMRGTPVKTDYGLTWELYGTFTKNNNTVSSLGVDQVSLGGFGGMGIVAAEGRPYGQFYSVTESKDSEGRTIIDPANGMPIPTSGAVYLGSYNPKFQASWGTNFTYKNWSLNALFDMKHGGKFFSRTKDIMAFVGSSAETGGERNRVIFPNSVYLDDDGNSIVNTEYTYFKQNYYPSREAGVSILDASYVKLRSMAIAYTFSKQQLTRTPFGSLTIGLYGNNLFIWTPEENQFADPEINSTGAGNDQGFDFTAEPSVRNYGLNVKVSF
ncbi:SusC/RagA family TonB-linked outer membrane protein [Parapedobacter tibetensis]|uniref:SusC/RagA family TonB-linked outer membrane protein n=1 Tax=Parapedobacter tibetensis TaxID=2972951 RepID=UPI00214D97AA|nr:SusC/RagA family TonB-linked outer membrane protein [Parapedobacter tibetensis]